MAKSGTRERHLTIRIQRKTDDIRMAVQAENPLALKGLMG
jgi:hypothetical protein